MLTVISMVTTKIIVREHTQKKMRMEFKHFTTKKKNQLNPKEESNVGNGGLGGGKLCKTNRKIVEVPPSQYSNPTLTYLWFCLLQLPAVNCNPKLLNEKFQK